MVQNKGWASLVSAAAVIPAPRVVGTIIGPKASVAGSTSLPLNPPAQQLGCGGYYRARRRERQAGTQWVGVKSVDPLKTTSGEGGLPERTRR